MSVYQPPLRDIGFVLEHIVDLESLSKLNGFQHADPGTVSDLLEEAGRFFSEVVAPLNPVGDTEGSVLTAEGTVKTPTGFAEAYRLLVEAGWQGISLPADWGGGGMPQVVGFAVDEMMISSSLAFSLCSTLTAGTVHLLSLHGSSKQKGLYLEKLISGEWSGTMNLTEPHAGSDVGALTTKAIPQPDGSYRITGTKIFITWGDHEMSDNIIHTVLARTPDAPPGTKGISLFVVAKRLVGPDGEPGRTERHPDRLPGAQAGHSRKSHLHALIWRERRCNRLSGGPRTRRHGPHVHHDERRPDRGGPRRAGGRRARLSEGVGVLLATPPGKSGGRPAG